MLVGQMKTALLEIRGKFIIQVERRRDPNTAILAEKFRPDRIIIECSYVRFS